MSPYRRKTARANTQTASVFFGRRFQTEWSCDPTDSTSGIQGPSLEPPHSTLITDPVFKRIARWNGIDAVLSSMTVFAGTRSKLKDGFRTIF